MGAVEYSRDVKIILQLNFISHDSKKEYQLSLREVIFYLLKMDIIILLEISKVNLLVFKYLFHRFTTRR